MGPRLSWFPEHRRCPLTEPPGRTGRPRRLNSRFLEAFLKLNAGLDLGHVAIGILGMPTEHERVRMRRDANDAGSVGMRIDMPLACPLPEARMAVGIGRFHDVDDALDFRRLTCLDGDRQSENPMSVGLDPAGIDPR
jgi:hypothetical protein